MPQVRCADCLGLVASPQQREHRVDLLLETFQRAFLLLGLFIDNGFLQLRKRVVGELQFQPTETGDFTLFRGHGVELRRRTSTTPTETEFEPMWYRGQTSGNNVTRPHGTSWRPRTCHAPWCIPGKLR